MAASSWVALRLGLRYLIPPFSYGLPSLVRAGKPSDFPQGSRRLLQRDRILIVHDPAGFRALSAVCSHLGCTVTLMEWGFNCPCHGSKFDWDGVNFAGPAPRPLDCFAVGLSSDGELVVDTRLKVPRDRFFSPPPAEPEA
ncbi:MAG TPA: ubiquinol-cytochrome c reductase iron-sulfur subunit [Anaerolineales bacterium]|nr:ubiquinol-cytochrome c reductase iron-sulfur subunit [Anaerolineales bacterium]